MDQTLALDVVLAELKQVGYLAVAEFSLYWAGIAGPKSPYWRRLTYTVNELVFGDCSTCPYFLDEAINRIEHYLQQNDLSAAISYLRDIEHERGSICRGAESLDSVDSCDSPEEQQKEFEFPQEDDGFVIFVCKKAHKPIFFVGEWLLLKSGECYLGRYNPVPNVYGSGEICWGESTNYPGDLASCLINFFGAQENNDLLDRKPQWLALGKCQKVHFLTSPDNLPSVWQAMAGGA